MITLNVTAPQGQQGLIGSDLKEISKWKMSAAANAEDINPADGYFKYFQQGSSLQLAINVVNNSSHDVKDLLINFKALLETEDLLVSLTQIDDNTKYRTATIASISSAYSTGSGYAILVDANVAGSNGSFVAGKDCIISFDSKGIQGFQGFQGARGFEGTRGNQGFQGNRGFQGTLIGDSGPQGFPGHLGFQGPQGPIGDTGPEGDPGTQGYQGVPGPQGPQGDSGVEGAQGAFGGPKGIQGAQGSVGYTGDPGYAGHRGVVGARGFQGPNQGYPGHQGHPGTVGNQGFQGITGPQGSVGAQGFQGVQGDRGFQGVQGPQGDQGPQGVQGVTGFAGAKGLQGAQGFAGDAGDQGAQGIQGAVGVQGTQGSEGVQGSTVTGPEGAQGDIGAQGNIGAQGFPGFQGVQGARGGTQGAQGAQGVAGDNEALYLETISGAQDLPASPSVGKIFHSSDGVYACSSASPVIWKKYPIVPSTFSKTTGEVIKASNLPPRWTATDAFDFLSWRLNEATGSTTFASEVSPGASTDLTITNTSKFTAGTGDGLFQKTITFTGSADNYERYLRGAKNILPTSSTSWSMSLWIKPYSNILGPYSADPLIFTKAWHSGGSWTSPYIGMAFSLSPSNTKWSFTTYVNGIGGVSLLPSTTLQLNQIILISATYDGSNIKIYENGILVGTSANYSGAATSLGSGVWTIGKSTNAFAPGHSFDGQLWDVRVANTVRSAAYYRAMYLDGAGRTED